MNKQPLIVLLCLGSFASLYADFNEKTAGLKDQPEVQPGLKVTLVAKEPLVRNPCSMAFDAVGNLFVGMGPQYRNPKPDTPRDSMVVANEFGK